MTHHTPAKPFDVVAMVEMYVASRLKSQRAVSTADAVKAIRTAMPKCELDDRALADLIASVAVRNRQNVIFDTFDERGSTATAF